MKRWHRGESITVSRLNEIQKKTDRPIRSSGTMQTIAGITYVGQDFAQSSPHNIVIARFRVKSLQNDYLVCRRYSPAVGTAVEVAGTVNIYVAKPYELRRTPFDGKTITYGSQIITYTYSDECTRIATDGDDTETQVMTPLYFVDCEILAVMNISGGTGLAVSDVPVMWEDLNTAGRFWAREA